MGRGYACFVVLGTDIVCDGAGRLLAAGSAKTDGTAAAALGLKAGTGIHSPSNPLVELTDMICMQGLGLFRGAGSRYCAEGTATPGRRPTVGQINATAATTLDSNAAIGIPIPVNEEC